MPLVGVDITSLNLRVASPKQAGFLQRLINFLDVFGPGLGQEKASSGGIFVAPAADRHGDEADLETIESDSVNALCKFRET